jgi:hypothetical protein
MSETLMRVGPATITLDTPEYRWPDHGADLPPPCLRIVNETEYKFTIPEHTHVSCCKYTSRAQCTGRTHLRYRASERHIPILLVHVDGVGATIVAHPDTEILDLERLPFENLDSVARGSQLKLLPLEKQWRRLPR